MIKKSPWITFFDVGGCIPGDARMIVDGELRRADDLINNDLKGSKIKPQHKEVPTVICAGETLAWKGLNAKKGSIIKAFKLKAPEELITIRTSTSKLELTPNHKVLVDTKDGPVWIKAEDLTKGQHLYSPRMIDIKTNIPKLHWENMPSKPDKDLLYVLGLIASDGFISAKKNKYYKIAFDNNEKTLINEFMKRIKKWVPESKPSYYVSEKQPNLFRVNVYSSRFVELAIIFGIDGFNKKVDLSKLFKLPENLISAFLAGYLDGDGEVSILKYKDRSNKRVMISYSVNDESIARDLQLLLKRLGIASRMDPTINKSSFGTKVMYRVRITCQEDLLRFIKKVKPKHPRKNKFIHTLEEYLRKSPLKQSSIDTIPLVFSIKLKELRKRKNLRQGELHKDHSFISMVENGRKIQKNSAQEIMNNLEHYFPKKELKDINKLLSYDFYLDPILEIKKSKCKDRFVYNFEVEGAHNYIPDGAFVVSNCNGCTLEFTAAVSPLYDIERFGVKVVDSAKHADIIIVAGSINAQAVDRLKRIISQVPDKKYVIAMGSCASSGGIFRLSYNCRGPLDKIIPVDMYIPGCPPKPEAIIQGVLKLLGRDK